MEYTLFPLPSYAHRCYVRVEPLPTPLDGWVYEAMCRACGEISPHFRVTMMGARVDVVAHMAEVDAASEPWLNSYREDDDRTDIH